MKDRVALVLAGIVGVLHLAFADRYDLFRDELYFIVCGRHPAFGYADQPPLVPLLAAGGYALGGQTWIVRLPAVLEAAALVMLVVAFVRLLGGGNAAACVAGIGAGFAPMLVGLEATLNTTSFEPLAWTAIAYALARAALLDDRRALLWAGVGAGVAMEAKYALPLWLVALAAGLLLAGPRSLFLRRELWISLAIAAALALPSVIWQALHGFPFAELVHNAKYKDEPVPPLAFALNQIVVFDPLFAPIWIAGLVAPFTLRALRPVRFLSIAFACCAVAIVAGHGKDYYLAPAYPPLFAIGAVALARVVKNRIVLGAYAVPALALALVGLPLALPVLAPDTLIGYLHALHIGEQHQERGDSGDRLPSLYADMLGWHDFAREVGEDYDSLPPAVRAHTSILVDNYGEAAALDLYGAPYALPPAISGHNQYYYFGLRGQHPDDILRVQDHVERLRPYCASVKAFAPTSSPYARSFENGKAIAFCRGLHPPLASLLPGLRIMI